MLRSFLGVSSQIFFFALHLTNMQPGDDIDKEVVARHIFEQSVAHADYAYHILDQALEVLHECDACRGVTLEAGSSAQMIKSEASVYNKLVSSSRHVDDALRSSYIIPPENFATCVRELYENLSQKCTNTTNGRELFFTDVDHDGIGAIDNNNTGFVGVKLKLQCTSVPVEVQCHTPNSKDIMTKSHPLYKSGDWEACNALARTVDFPEGVRNKTFIHELPRMCGARDE